MIVVKKILISTELLHFHINTNQEVNSHLRSLFRRFRKSANNPMKENRLVNVFVGIFSSLTLFP